MFGINEAAPYFDNVDIINAVNYAYDRRDTTDGDIEREFRLGELLDELRLMGAPDDCDIKALVENNYFASIRMWMQIQAEMDTFNRMYADRHDKPKFRDKQFDVFIPTPPYSN